MSEALLNEPQTPTDGKTAAQPDASAPESTTEAKAPASEKQQAAATETSKKEVKRSPRPSLETEPEKGGDKSQGDKPATEPTADPDKWELKNEGEHKVAPVIMSAYEKAARDTGMKAGDAQKVFDAVNTAMVENVQSTIDGWIDTVRVHPKLGGDKFEETFANVRSVLNEFGTPELTKWLLKGPGYHPGLVEFMNRVKREVGGDRIVTGAPPKGNVGDPDQAFYDRMQKG